MRFLRAHTRPRCSRQVWRSTPGGLFATPRFYLLGCAAEIVSWRVALAATRASREGDVMSRERVRILALPALVAAAVLASGCGAEDAAEPVPLQEAGVEPTLEVFPDEPAVVLPENFPEDLPIYPGVQRTLGSKADGRAMGAIFESDADPEEVFEYYKKSLVENGWEIAGEIDLGSQRALNARKGDEVASVLINLTEGKTQITLLTGKDPSATP